MNGRTVGIRNLPVAREINSKRCSQKDLKAIPELVAGGGLVVLLPQGLKGKAGGGLGMTGQGGMALS